MASKRTWYGRKVVQNETETVVVPVALKRSAPTWDTLPNALSTPVTVQGALTVSGVYRAVSILGTSVSQLDLGVYRTGVEIPAPTFITQPEYGTSLWSFLKRTTVSLALTGNAFWRVSYNAAGVPVNIEVLNPLAMVVERVDGKVFYKYTGYSQPKTFSEKEIKHLCTLQTPGRLTGLGVLEAAEESLQGILDLRSFAANWFNESGVPTGVLEVNADLDPEEIEQAQYKWHENLLRKRVGVTDKNTKFKPIAIDPSSALYTEQQSAAVTEIARWFGIPARLLLASFEGGSDTYANLVTDNRLFITYTLMDYLKPIEEALTALVPRGQTVKFKLEAFTRADERERAETAKTWLEAGVKTVEEVRAQEGLPPLNQGDATDVNE